MSESAQNLNQLLREIELELRDIDLWTEQKPASRAFQSSVPFCQDRMSFPEWIQWVMIPAFDEILIRDGTMPEFCEITPMAELAFSDISRQTDRLLQLIQQLDDLINAQAVMNH